jgi:transcriptional regulator with XRE-family HTH domain
MTLSDFCINHGITDEDGARALGCAKETFRRYRVGDRIPNPDNMRRIAAWTKGGVTANDFYGISFAAS